jgi:plasmid stability protein
MKTTLELPDELVRAVKLRALRKGRTMKEAIAELLRMGLAAGATPRPTISIDVETGLPSIQGALRAPIATTSTEEIQSQEAEDLERLGDSIRR